MTYGPLEKKLLKDIACLDYRKANVLDLIKKHTLTNKGLIVNFDNKSIELLVPLGEEEWIGEFFEVVSFMEAIEKDGLIYTHKNSDEGSGIKYISNNIDQAFIDQHASKYGKQSVPTNFFEKISKFGQSYIIPTNKLRVLVENNFKTEEQLNFERNLAITRFSLLVAILALFFSFLSPFLFSTTIDEKQLEKIINAIKVSN